jgi:ribosome biogenesis protein Nip4
MSDERTYERGEITRRGNELFERTIREELPADASPHAFVAIDIATGDYEVGESGMAAADHLEEREPDARGRIFVRRVGSKSAYHFSGRLRLENRETK